MGNAFTVSDFQELYCYLVDDFVIDFCKSVKAKDFILKKEIYVGNKFGKRQYISETKNREFLDRHSRYFETKVTLPRIRRGSQQEVETLISEETFLFAGYLRGEKPTWPPRIAALS